MRTALLLGVVLVVGGCGGGVRQGGPPTDAAETPTEARRGGSAGTLEEQLTLSILKEKHGQRVKVVQWGPHDNGLLAAEVAKRCKEGWTRFPTDLQQQLRPGTKIIRIVYQYIDEYPKTVSALLLFRNERHVGTSTYPIPDQNWLVDQLALLRGVDGR